MKFQDWIYLIKKTDCKELCVRRIRRKLVDTTQDTSYICFLNPPLAEIHVHIRVTVGVQPFIHVDLVGKGMAQSYSGEEHLDTDDEVLVSGGNGSLANREVSRVDRSPGWLRTSPWWPAASLKQESNYKMYLCMWTSYSQFWKRDKPVFSFLKHI